MPEAPQRQGVPGWVWLVVGMVLVGMALPGLIWIGDAAIGGGQPTTPAPTESGAISTSALVPAAADAFIRPADGMEMVYVPEGEFIMGSPDGEGYPEERPQHTVSLDAFWIDRYEVTNDQYRQCVEAGACDAPTSCDLGEPTYGDAGKGDHPVVCVIWHDAEAYCQWAGARLPTEAEWEKAARGTDARAYPWGNTFDGSRLNFCDRNCEFDDAKDTDADDGYARTAPVGSYPGGASPYGALDMAGNAWEWMADWYYADYYSHSPDTNPPGPVSGDYRVVRGGSWYNYQNWARSAFRGEGNPGVTFNCRGFRCCVSSTSSL